ncbi:DNA polymerase eta-like [Styela clava]
MSAFNRVIVLVDMDCFYVQVEQRRDPSLKGKPCAVVQYRTYRGGGIIAVGYEARAAGVTRGMMGDDAKEQCPEINLCRVPEANGKANLDRYREAGAEVINVLSQFGGRVERASIDEAYIDLTDVVDKIISQKREGDYLSTHRLLNTHIVGWPVEYKENEEKEAARFGGLEEWLGLISSESSINENIRLVIAGAITEEIRAAVYHQTGFRCSAGVSHNKMLSKLACGIHKPNKQTILPKESITSLFSSVKIGKIRNLGGKLGKSLMVKFGINFIGDVGQIPIQKLVEEFGHKNAYWLHEVCQGIDPEPVKERHVAQSIGCGRNFNGPEMLNTKEKVNKWLDALLVELSERLEKDKAANNRIARTLTVHVGLETGQTLSRSGPLSSYDRNDLHRQCLQLIRALDTTSSSDKRWLPALNNLSVNAKKFDSVIGGSSILKHTSKMKQPSIIDTVQIPTEKPSTSELQSVAQTEPEEVQNELFASQNQCLEKPENQDVKLIETGSQKIDKFFSEKSKDNCISNMNSSFNKLTQNSSQSTPTKRDDVFFVDQSSQKQKSISPKKSFFESVKKTVQKNGTVCKIDKMFLKEKENLTEKAAVSYTLPDGPVFHPLFGEIDKDVFQHLPLDIQQEISKSYKITSSVISSSPLTSSQYQQGSSKHGDKGQRLISNFIPSSQNSPETSYISPQTLHKKRKSSGPSPLSSKKPKTKSPKTRKSPGSKAKMLSFSSNTKDESVPLGFFRQRSQLNNAISKALTKEPRKFNG